jgi:hypothetical protein
LWANSLKLLETPSSRIPVLPFWERSFCLADAQLDARIFHKFGHQYRIKMLNQTPQRVINALNIGWQ